MLRKIKLLFKMPDSFWGADFLRYTRFLE